MSSIIIKCKDGVDVEVAEDIVMRVKVLADAFESCNDDDRETIVYQESATINKAVEFLSHLKEEAAPSFAKPLTTSDFAALCEGWYHNWINACALDMRFNLFIMAQELDIPELSDLVGAKIACDMKVMTIEQQREYLGI